VINVVVIDDSAFMRKALTLMMEKDPEIKVIATARDGAEGFEKVRQFRPDVVTLDIEMPRTNGLQCLQMIMKDIPTPVLVVSSVTTAGAAVTLEALEKGAVDFIPKTRSFVAIDITKIQDDLIQKVKQVSRKSFWARVRQRTLLRHERQITVADEKPGELLDLSQANIKCVAIGISTGGPPVVQKILSSLPASFPVPVLIAQHMPKEFTWAFADRLNKLSQITVKEAATGDVVQKGYAFIGQGGQHLVVQRRSTQVLIELTVHPRELLYHPSADVLFSRATEAYGSALLGLILTGMGRDGVLGLKELHGRGGKIIAQNEETCVVYGMPKAAVDANLTDAVLSVDGIIASLKTITN